MIAYCGFLDHRWRFPHAEPIEDVRAETSPHLTSTLVIEHNVWDQFLFSVGCSNAWYDRARYISRVFADTRRLLAPCSSRWWYHLHYSWYHPLRSCSCIHEFVIQVAPRAGCNLFVTRLLVFGQTLTLSILYRH